MTETSSGRTVAIIGGGYGGINVAKALDEHADVVLIEPREAFQHNVAALRAVVSPDWAEQIFFPYENLLARGRVVRDRAVEVEEGRVRLASGAVLEPDFIVLATGSTYPFPAKSGHTETSDAIAGYKALYEDLAKAPRVMLLGAGAVGLELAGEIAAVWPDKQITLVDSAEDVLPGPYDPRVREEVHRQLDALGVQRVLGSPLVALPESASGEPGTFTVTTKAGATVEADLWLQCFGTAPVTGYLAGQLAAARGADGLVAVTPELLVAGTSSVYAVGDILDNDVKRSGAAARHAAVVATNIQARIDGSVEPTTYTPSPPVILLPMGPEGGTGQVPGQDGPATAEFVANFKGRELMIERYRQLFGR